MGEEAAPGFRPGAGAGGARLAHQQPGLFEGFPDGGEREAFCPRRARSSRDFRSHFGPEIAGDIEPRVGGLDSPARENERPGKEDMGLGGASPSTRAWTGADLTYKD